MESRSTEDRPQQPSPAPAAGPYVRRPTPEHLTTWWWSLPEDVRSMLAGIRPGDLLSRNAEDALQPLGALLPTIVTTQSGVRTTRSVATSQLVHSLHLVRMTHSERRLV